MVEPRITAFAKRSAKYGLRGGLNRGLLRPAAAALCCALFCGCGLFGFGSSVNPTYYTIESGDTLWDIGQEYGISVEDLLAQNGISDPRQLSVGQRLLVRLGSGSLQESASTSASTADRNREKRPQNAAAALQPVAAKSPSSTALRGQGMLSWPLKTGRVVSRFGPRSGSFHDGLDIANGTGTPVLAAHSGLVQYAGNALSGYGNLVIIKGDDRLVTVYAHNDKLLVSTGRRVKRGEKIATVGSTGRSSGPHLHFEVRLRDSWGRLVAVDPLPLLLSEKSPPPRYRVNESISAILAQLIN